MARTRTSTCPGVDRRRRWQTGTHLDEDVVYAPAPSRICCDRSGERGYLPMSDGTDAEAGTDLAVASTLHQVVGEIGWTFALARRRTDVQLRGSHFRLHAPFASTNDFVKACLSRESPIFFAPGVTSAGHQPAPNGGTRWVVPPLELMRRLAETMTGCVIPRLKKNRSTLDGTTRAQPNTCHGDSIVWIRKRAARSSS